MTELYMPAFEETDLPLDALFGVFAIGVVAYLLAWLTTRLLGAMTVALTPKCADASRMLSRTSRSAPSG